MSASLQAVEQLVDEQHARIGAETARQRELWDLAQGLLPLNPQQLPGLSWQLAFNTAVSFMTNTNWQAYSGEASLSYFSQMVGLTTQNFVSAATGAAVAIALFRGIARQQTTHLGNFWQDLVRFYQKGFQPDAVTVVVVGDVEEDAAVVGELPGGDLERPPPPSASFLFVRASTTGD